MDPAALAALPTEKAVKMELKRGQVAKKEIEFHEMTFSQAEFHSAFTLHHSNPNKSKDQRRCAFIAR